MFELLIMFYILFTSLISAIMCSFRMAWASDFTVLGLTQPGLYPMIYWTRDMVILLAATQY